MIYLIYAILIFVVLFFIHKFLNQFKFPKIGALALFDGGVKVGKSALSVSCAISTHKRVHRSWKIQCFFIKLINLFKKKKLALPEEPLFYSSIPIAGVPLIMLDDEHLLRKKRFNYKSTVFIDEASLVADSQLIKDKTINTELLLFFKLFGHETKGGTCIYNSHNITDLHYALKRTTSQYFYVHHLTKWIPFFLVGYIREERYSEDGTIVNSYNEDIEDSLKRVILRKSVFKKYDSYAFSYLTDYLPTDSREAIKFLKTKTLLRKGACLKPDFLVSFRPELASLPSRQELLFIQELKNNILEEDNKNDKN